jgi:hypothetical protein
MGRIILILSLLMLSGCALFKPRIEYVAVNVPVSCDSVTKPEPLEMLPVKWQTATSNEGKVVLALDGNQYSNLSINIASIKAYIQNQKSVIQYYENCIERHNEKGPQ